ncbi:glycosyltransferase family 2 protein [Pseudomonas frederiksbergensis]|uniref:glycosyltransferase family 2 protein n=1 Tax=Pseudomonas frederiksbergensis TaxID=104087 RepID=UPI000F48BDDC|nr:glycosyltransferase family 2 protein [Pseudomonas frederiksbergensis]
MERPVFSIVIPTLARAGTFARALASIESQTFSNYEVIVIDDGSPEPYALDLCRKTTLKYTIIRHERSQGASAARNDGLKIAKGQFIAFLDDDDEYHPTFLQSTYDRIESTPQSVGLAWCSISCIDYPDVPGNTVKIRERIFDTEYPDNIALFEQLMSIGTGCGVTIKKECIDRVGLFSMGLHAVEDTDMFLRILTAGYVPIVIPGIHITVHNHKNARLSSVGVHRTRICECRKLLMEHNLFLRGFPSLQRQILRHINFLKTEQSGL